MQNRPKKELAKFEFFMWSHYLRAAVLVHMLPVCGGQVLPMGDHVRGHMLLKGYQGLEFSDQVLPGYKNGKKSVFAWREWTENCFCIVEVSRKVFWHGRNGQSRSVRASQAGVFGRPG